MKAISIRQPWASAIVMGVRAAEPRRAHIDHRGVLLIHASQTPAGALHNQSLMRRLDKQGGLHRVQCYGALIGAVQLTDSIDVGDESRPDLQHWAKWCSGGVLWLIEQPVVFREAIPWAGRPGLFDVPRERVREPLQHAMTARDFRRWSHGQTLKKHGLRHPGAHAPNQERET